MTKKPQRTQAAAVTDPILSDGTDSDIVIPIMGPTGAGKSTLLNLFLGPDRKSEHVETSASLVSCTTVLQPVTFDIPESHAQLRKNGKGRIVIVDTPGFDDTFVNDVDILKRIADWLAKSYRNSMKLGGVIYVHDIFLDRFTGTARRNLIMFQQICGEAAFPKVLLLTSKWSNFQTNKTHVAASREKEMIDLQWNEMIAHGAGTFSLNPPRGVNEREESEFAWKAVENILDRVSEQREKQRNTERERARANAAESFQIQRELVDKHRVLPQTHAGKELRGSLKEVMERAKHDPETMAKLPPEMQTRLEAELKEFKTPLSTKLKQIFGVYVSQ
ncbi:TKL/TKL-ccin protein kinase [Coprinopsis cinerea AmutBmut pab1-1]|nr:TKL/TKL-ccin protein kinase [Coprinopsis cinerea AmutBmut pab1-1]